MEKFRVINNINKVQLNDKVMIDGDIYFCVIDKEGLYSFEMEDKLFTCWGTFGNSIEELRVETIKDYKEGLLKDFIILDVNYLEGKITHKDINTHNISEEDYYNIMQNFNNLTLKEEIISKWKQCFIYILSKREYPMLVIEDLFNNFNMNNWKDLHKENTKYAEFTKEELS